MKKRVAFIVIILSLMGVSAVALILGVFSGDSTSITPRPSHWARPLQQEGLPNLHQVTPTLYRGGQPTAAGMQQLKAMGVKTVINLRSFNSDRDELGDTGLGYEHIYMKAWHPEREDIIRFLQIATDKDRTPAFVHCQHGADRTGLMCAIYRVAVCGWTKEEAIREMTQGGFGHHGIWKNIIRFIEELDCDAIKKEAGLVRRENRGNPSQCVAIISQVIAAFLT
jgi:protein tyrosine/serine phosphatase